MFKNDILKVFYVNRLNKGFIVFSTETVLFYQFTYHQKII